MKRFTGHTEKWGHFVDVKKNAAELLQKELQRVPRGNVMMSSITDPYQPIEVRYRLTRQCLAYLLQVQFPVDILTKSPLVLRDMDLISKFHDIEVGITITTDDDRIRKMFAPNAPPIGARMKTLKTLSENGINTYAFIGPLLPMNPEVLAEKIRPYVKHLFIDTMNYASKTTRIYRQHKISQWIDEDFQSAIIMRLGKALKGKEVTVC